MKEKRSTGIGLIEAIQIILIVLKIFNLIDITWFQVFYPTIGTVIVIIILGAIIYIRQ